MGILFWDWTEFSNGFSFLTELDDGKIYRKPLYLMVKTMVSCRFSLKPIHWFSGFVFDDFWLVLNVGGKSYGMIQSITDRTIVNVWCPSRCRPFLTPKSYYLFVQLLYVYIYNIIYIYNYIIFTLCHIDKIILTSLGDLPNYCISLGKEMWITTPNIFIQDMFRHFFAPIPLSVYSVGKLINT